jgi:hypothetical protein
MRVVFPRLADGTEVHALVHRDDGVVFRVRGNGQRCGSELPHDVIHFVVEQALGIENGFWGSVAAGAVFSSMSHVSGRRRPHAAETSKAIKREHRGEIGYAELMVWLIEQIADQDDDAIRRLTARVFATSPPPYPEPAALRPAVDALRQTAERWRVLTAGEELELTWRRPRNSRTPARPVGRQRRAVRRQRVVTRSAASRTS